MRPFLLALITAHPWLLAWRDSAARPALLRSLLPLLIGLLLSYLGLGWAGWRFIGPFGAAGLGLLNLPLIARGPCCAESWLLSPSEPVTLILLGHLPATLILLGLGALLAGLLAAALLRLESLRLPRWLLAGIGALLWLPLAPVALLAALALTRLGQANSFTAPALNPFALLIGALLLALLPAGLIRSAWRSGPEATARALYRHADILFAGWLAVETILNLPGLGGLLVRALRAADLPVAFALLRLLPLLWLWVRLGQMSPIPDAGHSWVPPTEPRPGKEIGSFAPLIALLTLGGLLILWRFPGPEPLRSGALPAALPPLGADALGRDLLGAAGLNLFDLAFGSLLAALLAGLLGWAWGRLLRLDMASGWPAAILHAATEWLTLANPAIAALLLMRAAGAEVLGGLALGLLLTPRLALTDRGPESDSPWPVWLAALPHLMLPALHLLITLGMLWPQPAGLLPDPYGLIAGVLAIRGAGYYGLALIGSLPPLLLAWALALRFLHDQ